MTKNKRSSVVAGNDSTIYEERIETNEFNQKPLKIDHIFTDEEKEAIALKKIKERKLKRKWYTEKNKKIRCQVKKAKNDKLKKNLRVV